MLAVLMNSMKLRGKKKGFLVEKVQNMDCCRTCLNTEDLEPLFEDDASVRKRASEIKSVVGLKVKLEDGLPQKICSTCSQTIKLTLNLREVALHSHTKLMAIYLKKDAQKAKVKLKDKKKSIKKLKKEIEIPIVNTDYEYQPLNYDENDIKLPNTHSLETNLLETNQLDILKSETKLETDLLEKQTDKDLLNYQFQASLDEGDWSNQDYGASEADDNLEDGSRTLQGEDGNLEPSRTLDGDDKPKIKRTRGRRVSRIPKLPEGCKPYCDICKKGFASEKKYKVHMKLHLDCCVCELCGKKCRNNNLLLLHKRGKHGAERIHKCTYCEYSAASKEALIIHERRHTGEKPYICDHCGSGFHRRSNLIQHIAIHLPDKNFQCEICSKRLKSRKFLQIHMHSAHTGKRYLHLCPACPRRFEKPNKVRAHLRSAHALAEPPASITRIEVAKRGYLPVPYPENST